MEGMGKAAKAIGRELKSSSPDLETIRASAKRITDFAPKIPSLFPPGTGPDVGKTRAKPDIWQNSQDFAAKAGDFQKAAQVFGTAALGSDVNAIKSSFSDLGKDCKACHDKYRAEEKH
jgi:cytochrome c556